MIGLGTREAAGAAAIRRLAGLAPLDPEAMGILAAAARRGRVIRNRQELLVEGRPIGEALLVLDGWAARIRYLADGRRQIMNFVLPGDLIGMCDQDPPIASSTVVALTPMTACPAPARGVSRALDAAYASSRAMEESCLFAQITRLGRLSAYERIVDLFLELLERLELAGIAQNGRFAMPLTQEIVADALGLTSVHVNRMLQQARRENDLIWQGRTLTLCDPGALRQSVGRRLARVARPQAA